MGMKLKMFHGRPGHSGANTSTDDYDYHDEDGDDDDHADEGPDEVKYAYEKLK